MNHGSTAHKLAVTSRDSATGRISRLKHYLQTELAAFWGFVRRPRRGRPGAASHPDWLLRCVFILLLMLVLELPLVMLNDTISNWAGLSNKLDDLSPSRLLLSVILFAPACEELLLRAGLRSARYTLFIGPALILLLFSAGQTGVYLSLALGLTASLVALWLHRRKKRLAGLSFKHGRAFIRHYPHVFWLYAVMFAVLHMGNYVTTGKWWLISAFLVIPQFMTGIALGYLRLRDGLKSSWLMHGLFNALLVTASILMGN